MKNTIVNVIKTNKKKVIAGALLLGAGVTALILKATGGADDEIVNENVEESVDYEVSDSPEEDEVE